MDHFGFAMVPRAALFDCGVLPETKPFSISAAYLWIVREARIKPTTIYVSGRAISLKKNQLSFSYRFLAEKFGWPLGKVQRYVKKLADRGYIDTDTRQGQLVLTVSDPTSYTRENVTPGKQIDTDGGSATDTQNEQRKNREQIDIQKKEHFPTGTGTNSERISSIRNEYLSLLTNTGIDRKRGIGLMKKWGREHGAEPTDRVLERCLAQSVNAGVKTHHWPE